MINVKIYDKNGIELKLGDRLSDGYDNDNWFEEHYNELYISGNRDMWRLEEFRLDNYKDGIMLIDFEVAK